MFKQSVSRDMQLHKLLVENGILLVSLQRYRQYFARFYKSVMAFRQQNLPER